MPFRSMKIVNKAWTIVTIKSCWNLLAYSIIRLRRCFGV